jgi:hypothetical protein
MDPPASQFSPKNDGGLSKASSQAAQVPSKVTCKLPRRPRMKARIALFYNALIRQWTKMVERRSASREPEIASRFI